MSDEDVSMSGCAAAVDAPSGNVHDNAESVIGAQSISSPMLWKSTGRKSPNNINGEPVASAPPKSSLKKSGADSQKSPNISTRNTKDKGAKWHRNDALIQKGQGANNARKKK
jgi:hypothetical protein